MACRSSWLIVVANYFGDVNRILLTRFRVAGRGYIIELMEDDAMFSEADVEAGAEALRQHSQGGKQLREWTALPNSVKAKWRATVSVVLTAVEQRRREAEGRTT